MTEELVKQDAIATVRGFLSALARDATDEALELLDPAIIWRNTSVPDVRGIERVGGVLRRLVSRQVGFDVEIHHIAAEGAIVLTDRTDYLTFGPVRVGFWATGTFELRDGRIVLWHDHFSWENVLRGIAVGLFRAVVTRR